MKEALGSNSLIRNAKQITAAYKYAEQLTECPECGFEIDEMNGKIATKIDGGSYYVPCPMLTQECRYGQELLTKLDKYAFDYINSVANVPLRFHKLFKNPQRTNAIRGANIWSESLDKKYSLVMHGDHGTGKSFAAAYSLANLARKRNIANWDKPFLWGKLSVMWVSPYQLTAKDDLLDAVQRTSVLVIDDLGSEVGMPRHVQKINEIISKRYDQMALTIITTNLDPIELETLYKRRFIERVMDCGEVVNCNGDSLRLDANNMTEVSNNATHKYSR